MTALDSPSLLLPFCSLRFKPRERSIARPVTRIQVKRRPKKFGNFLDGSQNSAFVYFQNWYSVCLFFWSFFYGAFSLYNFFCVCDVVGNLYSFPFYCLFSGICLWVLGTIPRWFFSFVWGFYMVSHTDVRNTSTSLKLNSLFCLYVFILADFIVGLFFRFVSIKLIYSEIDCRGTRLVTIFSSPTLYPNWTSSARVMGLFLRLLLSLACRVYSDIPARVVLQRFIPQDPSPAEIRKKVSNPRVFMSLFIFTNKHLKCIYFSLFRCLCWLRL